MCFFGCFLCGWVVVFRAVFVRFGGGFVVWVALVCFVSFLSVI